MGQTKHGDVDVDVPGIDADSAFAVTFKHDDEKLEENAPACVQCALLYTTSAGERRIRVLTLGLQTTSSMASLYRYTELDALMSIVMRKAVSECAGGGKTVRPTPRGRRQDARWTGGGREGDARVTVG